MPFHLDVVTAQRLVYSDDVDMVVAPGADGVMGILPRHSPLMSVLNPGELRIQKGNEEDVMAIGGGFIEVLNNQVTVLADSAERAEEIDIAHVEQEQQRVERALSERSETSPTEAMTKALRTAEARLKVARRRSGSSRP